MITSYGKKRKLVWTNAGKGNKRINIEANAYDQEIVEKVDALLDVYKTWIPRDTINPNGYSAKLAQLGSKNLSDISRFLSNRNLIVYSDLWNRMLQIEDAGVRNGVRSMLIPFLQWFLKGKGILVVVVECQEICTCQLLEWRKTSILPWPEKLKYLKSRKLSNQRNTQNISYLHNHLQICQILRTKVSITYTRTPRLEQISYIVK